MDYGQKVWQNFEIRRKNSLVCLIYRVIPAAELSKIGGKKIIRNLEGFEFDLDHRSNL